VKKIDVPTFPSIPSGPEDITLNEVPAGIARTGSERDGMSGMMIM
jgi:hypothetical protein